MTKGYDNNRNSKVTNNQINFGSLWDLTLTDIALMHAKRAVKKAPDIATGVAVAVGVPIPTAVVVGVKLRRTAKVVETHTLSVN